MLESTQSVSGVHITEGEEDKVAQDFSDRKQPLISLHVSPNYIAYSCLDCQIIKAVSTITLTGYNRNSRNSFTSFAVLSLYQTYSNHFKHLVMAFLESDFFSHLAPPFQGSVHS